MGCELWEKSGVASFADGFPSIYGTYMGLYLVLQCGWGAKKMDVNLHFAELVELILERNGIHRATLIAVLDPLIR